MLVSSQSQLVCDGTRVRMGVWGSRPEVRSQEGLMAGLDHLVAMAGVGVSSIRVLACSRTRRPLGRSLEECAVL